MTTKHADKIAALQADERGEKLQFKTRGSRTDWQDVIGEPCWEFCVNDYRPKPQRKFVPWNFSNCPAGMVIRNKSEGTRWVILSVAEDGVRVGHGLKYRFDELEQWFTQLDGKPCGTECEVEG